MKFSELKLQGAFTVDLEPRQDDRGFFARTFCREEFKAHGLNPAVTQCNASFNPRKGTLRGMHYQKAPHGEAKFIRCTSGSVFDVIIDLRPESPTFKQWVGLELPPRTAAPCTFPSILLTATLHWKTIARSLIKSRSPSSGIRSRCPLERSRLRHSMADDTGAHFRQRPAGRRFRKSGTGLETMKFLPEKKFEYGPVLYFIRPYRFSIAILIGFALIKALLELLNVTLIYAILKWGLQSNIPVPVHIPLLQSIKCFRLTFTWIPSSQVARCLSCPPFFWRSPNLCTWSTAAA